MRLPRDIADPAWRAALEAAITAAATPQDRAELAMVLAEQAAALLLADGGPFPAPIQARLERFAAVPGHPIRSDPVPQALFIDEGVPAPRRDAGSNAALSHIAALTRLGFRVHFVAGAGMEPSAGTSALEAMGVTCWHLPWVGSVEEVLRALGPRLALVYVHRFAIMQRYGALVRRWAPDARLLYCVADLQSLRTARRIAVEAGLPADAPEGHTAAASLRLAEYLAITAADAAITHSSHEAALLRAELPEANIILAAWEVPLAAPQDPTARHGVAFIGSYGHAPNLDAAHTLIEDVMPLVWAEAPDITVYLAGSDLPATLRRAAERAAGPVEVLGWVENLDAVLARLRLTAAPLRYGAGLKGKVLDSTAAGVPCLCTPMAAEGMDLPPSLATLICTTLEAMASRIIALHRDDAEHAALAAAGRHWIAETFTPARIDAALRGALGASGDRDPGRV